MFHGIGATLQWGCPHGATEVAVLWTQMTGLMGANISLLIYFF